MVRFRARLSHMGGKLLIIIPKALELEVQELEDKELVVTLTDAKSITKVGGKMPDSYWRKKDKK